MGHIIIICLNFSTKSGIFKIFKKMCLYPRLIKNKRYLMYNIKRKERIPLDDIRKKYVAIGCGNCIECRKQRAREWQVRLSEELKVWKHSYFVTLTFSCEEMQKLCEEDKELYTNVNTLAQKAVRRFLERWRKKYKTSVKHWLITELGHEGTERIHLHGILFTNTPINNDILASLWKYGITYTGDYCNERTINYIVKYVTKIDTDHKNYKADIFCSSGIGRNYIDNPYNKEKHAFKGKNTVQYYTLKDGHKINLPNYYRNHFWTQAQRDQLWTNILDADKTWVRGIECKHISGNGYNTYLNILQAQQQENIEMGYGSTDREWKEKEYAVTFNMLNARAHEKSRTRAEITNDSDTLLTAGGGVGGNSNK